ncbi:SDR family oxidoreductase [Chitinophaga vietnamensis]|uniref:SDR family oxidoreductase n=1 Tax=Chitinophaga vietnamensis TaxID=2593957 RepID=UPI0011773C6D|nr:SDR family oxidoreductase [Chitinophaga vietnamensis]
MRTFANDAFKGKTAIVVGGSRGIGKAMVEQLAAAGAAVAISYAKSAAIAEEMAEKIRQQQGKAVAIQADISQLSAIKTLFDKAEESLGTPDIVIANAANYIPALLSEATEEQYDTVFNTNAKGIFFVLQEAARRVKDGGRIIVTSTGGTQMYFTMNAIYLGSKGAVEQFVRVLSRELGARNITVNAVSPGFTNTDLLPERDRAVAAEMSPFKRVGEPEDVADVAVFLASDAARWITGQNIAAGGGVF